MSKTITPGSEAELVEFVRSAAAKKTALKIIGGATRQAIGHDVSGKPVSTAALSGITLYEPASLTLVVEAGTPVKEVVDTLAGEGQHLPFEPADYRALFGSKGNPTIGGVAACAISGPRRIQAGACRDSMIGVRFINGEGDVIKNGGRVMKNVTGYDLVKLLCGSYGTLGIITQLSFKLLPAPERTTSVQISGITDKEAVAAMSAALGSPFDVSGAAFINADKNYGTAFIRLEGFKKSVSYRAEKIKQLLATACPTNAEITIETAQKKVKQQWQQLRDVEMFADRPGALWRLSIKPGDSPAVVEKIRRSRKAEIIYDWGGGLVWLLTSADEKCGEDTIRAAVNEAGGHATLMRQVAGTEVENVFHPLPKAVAAISAGLRRQFDPHSILNPGRMGD